MDFFVNFAILSCALYYSQVVVIHVMSTVVNKRSANFTFPFLLTSILWTVYFEVL